MTNPTQRRFYSDGRSIWYTETIWAAASSLPSEEVLIEQIRGFDEVCWFSDIWGKRPTCRAVVEHCARMNAADLSYPIILAPNGDVLDGMHRVGKAAVAGLRTMRAIRIREMPPPDDHIQPNDARYQAGAERVGEITIEPMHIVDYDDVLALWKQHAGGIGLNDSDTRDGIAAYLERNPELSLVARREKALVGALLCGHDGRRGFLHHLGVSSEHRRMGIGTALVERSVVALARLKIHKCNIFVFSNESDATKFWIRRGFSPRTDLSMLQRRVARNESENNA